MSIPPEPPETSEPPGNSTAHSTAKSAEGPKFYFVALCPLVGGTALMVLGFFALFGLLYNETSYAVLFVFGAIVVIGGTHFWLQWILEGRDEPRPWQFPIVLSAAMVAGIFITLFPIFMNADFLVPLPLVSLGLSLLGVLVFSLGTERNRLVLALGAILGVVLLIVGVTWWIKGQEQDERKEELLQDVSDFPHEIAVLELAGWEPTAMWASEDLGTASITYQPEVPSPEFDGFTLALQSESMEEIAETGWTPLYSLCESDGGDKPCGEHGDIVIADFSRSSEERFEARTEFTDGGAANLMTGMPTDENEEPTIDFPDIDTVELAGQIRPAEPGEAEGIASEVMD
ncbi:hypothetical protein [Nocardiopsis xinjiangensis]|uniref:hypothetical protein n=1 Tax=Nocardiopsis xinjiangensis TaxID=124285 RepID=UPI0003458B1A|nr:hypothetical protein [Nocardiopsis xinjiangensis]